ncbi:uncharacterized protein LOC142570847 [Dermacentor variabilis]|uniref:uncharacterized protein LOC142570847 n=1 Tax=Dermacentor variabilis TaxID=34621 RepID=UPI003F5AFB74
MISMALMPMNTCNFICSPFILYLLDLWNLRRYPVAHLACAIISGGFLTNICLHCIHCIPVLKFGTSHSDACLIELGGFKIWAMCVLAACWMNLAQSSRLLCETMSKRRNNDGVGSGDAEDSSRPHEPALLPAGACVSVLMCLLLLVTVRCFDYGTQDTDSFQPGAARLTLLSALCSFVNTVIIYTVGPVSFLDFLVSSSIVGLPLVAYSMGRMAEKRIGWAAFCLGDGFLSATCLCLSCLAILCARVELPERFRMNNLGLAACAFIATLILAEYGQASVVGATLLFDNKSRF